MWEYKKLLIFFYIGKIWNYDVFKFKISILYEGHEFEFGIEIPFIF